MSISESSNKKTEDSAIPSSEHEYGFEENSRILPERSRDRNSISDTAALIHLVKMNVGIGVMAMPTAFYNSGTVFGLIAMSVIAITTVHCMHLLVNAGQTYAQRINAEYLDYAEVVDVAFDSDTRVRKYGKIARNLVNVFLCIAQIGGFAIYILFISKNLQSVFASDAFGFDKDYRIFLLAIFVPTILICSIRNLDKLAPVTVIATVCEFYTLSVVFYYYFSTNPFPKFSERPMIAKPEQLPIFFGAALFTFEGIGLVLPLENKMRKKEGIRGWFGVLNTGMVFVACLTIAVGFFGYLVYGDLVGGSDHAGGSITLNLPKNELLANSARIVISVAILLSNPLQFYVAISIIFPNVISPRVDPSHHLLAEYVLRYLIIIVCFLVAAATPDLDLIISLDGAIIMAVLSLITPAVLDLLVKYPNCSNLIKLKNSVIILSGILVSIFGTVMTIIEMVNRY